MAFNGSGVYTLPAGNPVVSGTVISSTWANNTDSDIAAALNNVVTRDGQGVMTAPLNIVDGTVTAPGLRFNSEVSTGVYRNGTGTLAIGVLGGNIATFTTTGLNAIAFNATSTAALKKNIKKLPKATVDKFDALQPRAFEWRRSSATPGKQDFGFIAEEMQKVYPEIVATDEAGNATGIQYDKLTTILTAKVKELEARIKKLEG